MSLVVLRNRVNCIPRLGGLVSLCYRPYETLPISQEDLGFALCPYATSHRATFGPSLMYVLWANETVLISNTEGTA